MLLILLVFHCRCWFLVFVFFWTSEFITALGKISLSICFSNWYYTPDKEEGNAVSACGTMGTAILKHAGTAAFGSLLIKPIRFIRAPLLLLQSCIKRSEMDNKLIDAIICLNQCGLFLLERFLKFTSKSAYNHTAIFGTSFCKSSHESYYLALRNAEFLREAGPVSKLSVFYCKFLICSSVSLVSFKLLDVFYGEELFSIVSVTAVIAILSWFIGEIFTDVIGEAVSTILYCYVADEEIMGEEGSPFVTPELDEFLDELNDGNDTLAMGGVEYTDNDVDGSGIPSKIL